MKLTTRQIETLVFLAQIGGAVASGADGSVLRSLARKGLVLQHHNTAPGYVYYTWTLTAAGKAYLAAHREVLNQRFYELKGI